MHKLVRNLDCEVGFTEPHTLEIYLPDFQIHLSEVAVDFVQSFTVYMIAAGELYHVITTACEALYFVFVSGIGLFTVFSEFWLPVLFGNTIGGVVLVALVNYAQTAERRFPDRDHQLLRLSWSDWLFGLRTTQPEMS